MNESTDLYLRKTLFWQRVALVVLSIFLLVVWTSIIYFFMEWYSNTSFLGRPVYKREQFWFFSIVSFYLCILSYIGVILFQATKALSFYLKDKEMADLEMAFRKQRHFWMGLIMAVLGCFGTLLFLILVLGAR